MHSCVLNMNLFSSFALGFEYWAILGIWENSKTDPPEKPTAKLLKELKKMIYIKMHFQIRNQAKLSKTRSPLYRKLWRWDFAYVQLSSCSVRIYAPLTRIRPKNSIFACAIFRRHAAAFAAFTDSPIEPSYIREEERNTTQNIVPHSTPRSTPILLKFGGFTLRPSTFRLFKPLEIPPRFRRVPHCHSALLENASKKFRIFASARCRLYQGIFRFFLHFRVEYALISL